MRDAVPKVAGLLDFTGKTIVVTGASAGIGAGIARRFVEAGASVAINYRSDRSGAEALADSLGAKAIAVHADITDQAAVEALMQAAVDRFGGLDGLINNAALQDHGAFMELPGDRFDQMLQANVGGAFRCAQAAAKHMDGRRRDREHRLDFGARTGLQPRPLLFVQGGADHVDARGCVGTRPAQYPG